MDGEVGNFVSGLGPFPLLQLFGGLAVLGVGVFAWMRGSQHRGADIDIDTILRLDGPIAQLLRKQDHIVDNTKACSNYLSTIAEEQRNQRRLLVEIKEAMERGWPPPRH